MHHPIIASARSYIGTRFHHQGRLKKTGRGRGGIDCLGLMIGVARECDLRSKDGSLLAELDETFYPHQPDALRLRAMLETHLDSVSTIQIADIALFCIDGHAQHLGIISDRPEGFGIIHAYAPTRAVVEHALDDYWRGKIKAIFRLAVLARE